MRHFIFILSVFVLTACGTKQATSTYVNDIKSERKKKNKEFSNKDKSPLEEKDMKTFIGLNYFPIDSNFRIKAEFTKVDTATPFQMPTSTDRLPMYVKEGILSFEIDTKTYQLSVFKNLDNPDDPFWFIPFSDLTSGNGTYGGGRYIDFQLPKEGNPVYIDFNTAYNPYCAYNHKYSCPIPPRENDLQVAIKAGEKTFKEY